MFFSEQEAEEAIRYSDIVQLIQGQITESLSCQITPGGILSLRDFLFLIFQILFA